MKVTPWEDVLSGSGRVRQSDPVSNGPQESLFSLLVKVESQLRAGIKHDSQNGLGRYRSSEKKVSLRSISSNLSRYIE